MNLTIATTIYNENTHTLIGPKGGCPVLYVRDEDNPDKRQGLKTSEFFHYLYKNGCLTDVGNYVGTEFYLSWFYIMDGQELTDSDVCTLQDIFPLYIDLKEFKYVEEIEEDPRMRLLWLILRDCFSYIYTASFDAKLSGDDIPYSGSVNDDTSSFVDVYKKLKEKFGAKLSKETFIQSVQGRLQKREKWNLSEKNIEGIVSCLRNILVNEL